MEPTKEHSVIHIYQLCVLAGCKVSEGYRYKITAPSGRSAATLHPPKPFTPLYSSSTGRRPFRSGAFVWPPPSSSIDIFPLHRRNVSWRRCLGRVRPMHVTDHPLHAPTQRPSVHPPIHPAILLFFLPFGQPSSVGALSTFNRWDIFIHVPLVVWARFD